MTGWVRPNAAVAPGLASLRALVQAHGDEENLRAAGHAAGEHLAGIVRQQLRNGPEEHRDLADHVGTWDTADNVLVGVHPSSPHAQRFRDHEWGGPGRHPRPILRTTLRTHARAARQVFMRRWSS